MSHEVEWYIAQGGVNPHPMGTEKVAKSQYNLRLRLARFFADKGEFAGVDRAVFIDAVMCAPSAIYHDDGTMSPIDFESIGIDAVRGCVVGD